MSLWDGLFSSQFKKDNDGKTIYIAKRTAGYFISSEDEKSIKHALKKYYCLMFLPAILFIGIFKFPYSIYFGSGWMLIILPFFYMKLHNISKNLEQNAEKVEAFKIKITFIERLRKQALATGLPITITMWLFGFIMVSISVFALFNSDNKLPAVGGVLFFGLAFFLFSWQLIIIIKEAKRR